MKKFILFSLILSTFFISCTKQPVYLPQLDISGETDIQNHSEIWVFYNEKTKKADVNKNNLITTTNWIINIDKKLLLSEVIPVFQMVKAKRAKKSIHSAEGMKDYITYSNTKDKNVSAFRIDSTSYMLLPKNEIQDLNQENPCTIIDFSPNSIRINKKDFSKTQWNKSVLDSLSGCIQLQFDQGLNYQEYMEYRLTLNSFLPKEMSVETTEYIYK